MPPSMQMFGSVRPGGTEKEYTTEEAMALHAKRVEHGIEQIAKYVYLKSLNIVPIDSGTLANSAAFGVEGSGFQSIGIVSYGAEYAVYVHEDKFKVHGEVFNTKNAWKIATGAEKLRRPQERSKFLQSVVEEDAEVFDEIMALEVLLPGSSASIVDDQLIGLEHDRRNGQLHKLSRNPFRLRS